MQSPSGRLAASARCLPRVDSDCRFNLRRGPSGSTARPAARRPECRVRSRIRIGSPPRTPGRRWTWGAAIRALCSPTPGTVADRWSRGRSVRRNPPCQKDEGADPGRPLPWPPRVPSPITSNWWLSGQSALLYLCLDVLATPTKAARALCNIYGVRRLGRAEVRRSLTTSCTRSRRSSVVRRPRRSRTRAWRSSEPSFSVGH